MILLAVTGADGSGKSTACVNARALLEARLGPGSVHEVSVWDALRPEGSPFSRKQDAERYLADLDGPSRTLFIFHSLSRALQLGRRSGAKVLLLNGYWYKYAVSELGYRVDPKLVFGAAQAFEKPHAVIMLDVSPETAWERRKAASAYEAGGGSGDATEARTRFLGFQTQLRQIWARVESESLPRWTHVSSLESPEAVALRICETAMALLNSVSTGGAE